MFANSKKIVLALIAAVGFAVPSHAVHEEFVEGYEFSSSQASSKMQERPMSLYKDGKVVEKDLKLIESLLLDLKLTPGVVNVLIDYVLKVNNQK